MGRYSIIVNGRVDNFAEATPEVAAERGWKPAGTGRIGDIWTGSGYASPPAPAMDAGQLQAEIIAAAQKRLDDFAKLRNYDSILSVCTYATSAIPKFAAEAQVGIAARDQTWATLYSILDEINTGARPMPGGYADIEPLLPPLEWPEA